MAMIFRKKDGEEDNRPVAQEEGLFHRLRQRLSKTRSTFTGRLDRLFLGKKEITDELLEELEELLFTSDIGVATTQELIDSVQEKVARHFSDIISGVAEDDA